MSNHTLDRITATDKHLQDTLQEINELRQEYTSYVVGSTVGKAIAMEMLNTWQLSIEYAIQTLDGE